MYRLLDMQQWQLLVDLEGNITGSEAAQDFNSLCSFLIFPFTWYSLESLGSGLSCRASVCKDKELSLMHS